MHELLKIAPVLFFTFSTLTLADYFMFVRVRYYHKEKDLHFFRDFVPTRVKWNLFLTLAVAVFANFLIFLLSK